MELKCNIDLCSYNQNNKCTFKDQIVIDYMGIEAQPTCINFKKGYVTKIEDVLWNVKDHN